MKITNKQTGKIKENQQQVIKEMEHFTKQKDERRNI